MPELRRFSSSTASLPQQSEHVSITAGTALLHPPISPSIAHDEYPANVNSPHLRQQVSFKMVLFFYVLCPDEDICKLYCIAENFDFFFAMSSKVKDGTPCSNSGRNVCIEGVCEVQCFILPVGCVKMLNLIGVVCMLPEKRLMINVKRGSFFM